MNATLSCGLAALLCLSACSSDLAGQTAGSGATKASLFEVPKQQLSQLQIVTVEHGPVDQPLRVPAEVSFDELHTTDVVPLVSGVVDAVRVTEGDHVKAGQTMLTIASPDSSDALASLRRDQAALSDANAVLARDEDLYAHHGISQEELESARAQQAAAQATVEDDRTRVKLTGTGEKSAALKAPISGLVVARHVARGSVVAAGGTPCFTITDPTSVWVVGDLYQQDLERVSVGDAADIHVSVFKKVLTGHVTWVGAAVDPGTLTVPVRIAVPNPNGLLKAGMYVDAGIHPAHPEDAILLPAASVLRDEDNLPFVYLQAGDGAFARRKVELGGQVGENDVIRSGVKDGDKVLANGAVFVQFADSLE